MPFDHNSRDMTAALSQMQREALARSNGNQLEATKSVEEWIRYDRRFDAYDPHKLAKQAEECRTTGATLNLEDDPSLLKTRPQNRYGQGRVAS